MLNKKKNLRGEPRWYSAGLHATVPMNEASGEPLPKYVIDKSWSVPKLNMQKSTTCAETVNRAFQRTGPRWTGKQRSLHD